MELIFSIFIKIVCRRLVNNDNASETPLRQLVDS